MNLAEQALVAIGARAPLPVSEVEKYAAHLPDRYFQRLASTGFECFDFLSALPFVDAFNYVKGLVECEKARICPFPGSTSLVIRAFATMKARPINEWAAVAVWIVHNHDNPYTPFNFRRTRDHWEQSMRELEDPLLIAERAAEIENAFADGKREVAERHVAHECITSLHKNSPPPSSDIRQRMIDELEREAGWPEYR